MLQIFFIQTVPMAILYGQELVPGTIKGIVSDRATGRVISNANINLFQNDADVSSVTTGDDGAFIFLIPSGSYDLKAAKRGFREDSTIVTLAGSESITQNFSLSPIQADNNVDQTIKSSGAQTGSSKTTTSAFGFINGAIIESVTGLSVSFAFVSLNKAGEEVVFGVSSDDGAYFLEALPGEYVLAAKKEGFNTKLVDVSISAFGRTNLEVALDVEGGSVGTPTPVTSPTIEPDVSLTPTPTATSVPVETPIPTVTPEPFEDVCEGGGNPGFMRIKPAILSIRANSDASIKITLFKDEFGDDLKNENASDNRFRRRKRSKACVTDIKVECGSYSECRKLKLFRNKITTDKQGVAHMVIRAKDVKRNSLATLKFTAGDLVKTFIVIILANDEE